MLASMNSLEKLKNRLIEITADGEISIDEIEDFARIESGIEEIAMAADALTLWKENMMASGRIDAERLAQVRKLIKRL